MRKWRQNIENYTSIKWLLIAVVLLMTFVPQHLHVHHAEVSDTSGHAHYIDSHSIHDNTSLEHHEQGAIEIDASNEGILKLHHINALTLLLLVMGFIFLPAVYKKTKAKFTRNSFSLKHYQFHLTPPLRAPPL